MENIDEGNPENNEISSFEKELKRLPKDIQDKLIDKEKKFKPLYDEIKKKVGDKCMGFYIGAQIDVDKSGRPIPNFEKLTVYFLLDDFERPIQFFDGKLLLGQEFDKFLVEKKTKEQNGQEYIDYFLKGDENIRFFGSSISILRENCYDGIYDDLKALGASIIYDDSRGFISALKTVDIHRNMLLQKFEKYVVVYAGAGSWLRGEKSNDFDVFIVIDDTDVKRMPRLQVKDQLTKIIWQMSREVAALTGIQIHIQVYLLTDFWDALKDAHPVMFTFLRDGVPFYDRGLYSAWKELLKLGKIRPSPEAIDMHMNVGNQLIDRAKKLFADVFMNEVHYAVLNPSQALLMLKGYNPTTPKETVKIFKEVLLEKEKTVTKEDVKTLEESFELFKKVEHDKSVEVSGEELDSRIKRAEKFLDNIKQKFQEITDEKTKDSIVSSLNELQNQIRSIPGFNDVEDEKLLDEFNKEFVETNKLAHFVKESFKEILKARSDHKEGKITVTEVNKTLKEIRNVLSEIKSYRDSNILDEVNKRKFFFSFGDNGSGEIFVFDSKIYMVENLKNEIYTYDGSKFEKSSVKREELLDTTKIGDLEIDEKLIASVKGALNIDSLRI